MTTASLSKETSIFTASDYLCPACRRSLAQRENYLICESCKGKYQFLEGGIPDFSRARNFYHADIPKAAMQVLLDRGKEIGWKEALAEALDTLPVKMRRYAIQMLFNEGSAAWKYLLNISREKRVLDCGAGNGILSIALARSFKEVISFDLTGEQLQLLQMRAKTLGIDNITCVKGGDTPFLPFPDGSFDAVVLNGVLKWVPESRQGNPRKVQLALMKEINRVLKSGGECIIGIENRYSFESFMGRKDAASALSYSSLMPRKVANLYSIKKQGKPYRTYTYSMRGYKKLFKNAGLKPEKFFSPYPTYRRFSQMLTLSADGKVTTRFFGGNPNSRKTKLMNSGSFLKVFTPSFFILGNKGTGAPSYVEKLLPKVSAELNHALGLSNVHWKIDSFLVASGNKVLLMLDHNAPKNAAPVRKMVVNIPMNPYADERLRENASMLDQLRHSGKIPDTLLEKIPRNVLSGELDGENYYVEEMLPGVPGEGLPISRSEQKKLIRSAFDAMMILHQAFLDTEKVDDLLFEEHFAHPMRETAAFFGNAADQKSMALLISQLKETIAGKTVPLVWRHGDFSLKNLLFDTEKMVLSGMIDWDLSQQKSLPLIDLFQICMRVKMTRERKPFTKTLLKYMLPLNFSGYEGELIREYMDTFSIDAELAKAVTVAYWISRVHPHVGSFKDLDVVWIQDNFREVLDHLRNYF